MRMYTNSATDFEVEKVYLPAILLGNLELYPNPIHIEFCPAPTGQELAHSVGLTRCPLLQLPLQQWYFGQIKQADAEKLLLQTGNSTGTFLIRESESQPGNYVLSVRYKNCVKHYLIKKEDTGNNCMLHFTW